MRNYVKQIFSNETKFRIFSFQRQYRSISIIIFQNFNLKKSKHLKYTIQNKIPQISDNSEFTAGLWNVFSRKYSSELTSRKYHQLADITIEKILHALEQMQDNYPEKTIEIEYSQGVLTLDLGYYGTYVLNKQPFNKQIWVSSPISGPKRYDWIPSKDKKDGKWMYLRDNGILEDLFKNELKEIIGDLKL
ncbi:hypothetical protein PCANB_002962 [Pneumocystis canis]|nr:hypothetical protein PCK1_003129 [Pneumocystis canis]KAG5438111.1 hypothetical protein PCANB_002962 [Pneumocystis canis]